MLMGHTDGLSERTASVENLDHDHDHAHAHAHAHRSESEIEDDDDVDVDVDGGASTTILYAASFQELSHDHINYDTIIWLSISLLLVLAWGVGIIMLLYLPYRRYVLRKDVSSRKLYVTPSNIVYKLSRPSFIPFYHFQTIEKQVPLSLVIDIIIEQGWLQSIFGMHTFRVESIAHGKAAPVDELLVQGVSDPKMLRKIIITEASKVIQEAGKNWKPVGFTAEGETVVRMPSVNEGPAYLRSPSKNLKMTASPRYASMERERRAAGVPGELLLNKLDEINRSVKKIESLIGKSQGGAKE